ncbi:MAG: thioredoxin [Planctomycetia bacterium]|nr:thioredoxin [Planctomycetia bacterium]
MGKAIDLNENNFDAVVLQSDIPVLVDFWSTTCGPCRAIAPILDELAEEYAQEAKIVKVNVFENTNIAGKLNISSLPTLIIFDQGQMVERLVGAQSKERLQNLLEEYV